MLVFCPFMSAIVYTPQLVVYVIAMTSFYFKGARTLVFVVLRSCITVSQ